MTMHDTVADSFVMRHWELAVVMHAWLTANAMADAWEDTAGCAQADCQHGNFLLFSSTGMWGLHRILNIGS